MEIRKYSEKIIENCAEVGGVFGMHEEMARLRNMYLPERYSDNPNIQKPILSLLKSL